MIAIIIEPSKFFFSKKKHNKGKNHECKMLAHALSVF